MKPHDNKFIPTLIMTFYIAFVVVIFAFVFVSFKTYTGVVTENAYEKGVNFTSIYKKSLEKHVVTHKVDISLKHEHIKMSITPHPSKNAVIRAKLVRTAGGEHDIPMEFFATADGKFLAKIPHDVKGAWELRVKLTEGTEEEVYNRRFFFN